jgi:hypothetical protein
MAQLYIFDYHYKSKSLNLLENKSGYATSNGVYIFTISSLRNAYKHFEWKNLKGRDLLRQIGGQYQNGSYPDIGWKNMEWIQLTHDRDQWLAVGNLTS